MAPPKEIVGVSVSIATSKVAGLAWSVSSVSETRVAAQSMWLRPTRTVAIDRQSSLLPSERSVPVHRLARQPASPLGPTVGTTLTVCSLLVQLPGA